MTNEEAIIAAVRVLGALPVLRWPFYGALFALLVDQGDLLLMNLLDLGGVRNYQEFDKHMDQAYLLTFFISSTRWSGPQFGISAVLYAYRFAGFVAFEISGSRNILLFFPNLFEFWFILAVACHHFGREGWLRGRALAIALSLLLALKLFQEYALHHARWLDAFTTVEAIEAVWDFLTPF